MTLPLDMRSLAYFDDARRAWVADAGDFEVCLGHSSAEVPVKLAFRLKGEWSAAAGTP